MNLKLNLKIDKHIDVIKIQFIILSLKNFYSWKIPRYQMKGIFLLGCLLIVISQVNSIYFGVSARPFCFELDREPGKIIKFSYEVTGQSP